MVSRVVAFVRVARVPSSLLVTLAIFLPILWNGGRWDTALSYAVPILPICTAAFLLNDLHDLERDRENHPHRPLPTGAISVRGGAILFFALLGTALALIESLVPEGEVFLYATTVIALINYNYVVSYTPVLKNVYIAAVAILPLLIIGEALESPLALTRLGPPVFLFVLGTEMLSDIKDYRGDVGTAVKGLGLQNAARLAFISKGLAGLLLLFGAKTKMEAGAALAILLLEIILFASWRRVLNKRHLMRGMALQMMIGSCFLLQTMR